MFRYAVVVTASLAAVAAGCGGSSPPPLPQPVPAADATAGPSAASNAGRRIGPDDLLEVTVFEAPEISRSARVATDGTISLPVLGSVPAAGLTPNELAAEIEGRLRGTYMVAPQVSVDVAEVRTQSIYVLGAVNKPGAFPLTGYQRVTVLQALALGEGLQSTASRGNAFIIRHDASGQRLEIPVDIESVLEGQGLDPALEANDIVYVPNSPTKSLARGVADALVRMVTLGRIF
jgi:polysaccharide export outer membrane protein